MDIKVLPMWSKNLPADCKVIDTTSNSGQFRDLSPFVLNATKYGSYNFENLWQYSKVYCPEHVALPDDEPCKDWYTWRDDGFNQRKANRYPMGKGRKPAYSYWCGEMLGYIEARKKIYAPIYAELVQKTYSFRLLTGMHRIQNIILLDYDAYDHKALGMTLKDVINNPDKKCGHAFILMMMLTGELEECIK